MRFPGETCGNGVKDEFRADIKRDHRQNVWKNIGACTDAQLYTGVLQLTKEKMAETPVITGDKKVYYISMEFLIGKLLSNNLINLGIYEELSDILKKTARIWQTSKRQSRNPLLVTVDLEDWQHVSWIPSLLWDFPETV